jgi:stage V sporulation protein K
MPIRVTFRPENNQPPVVQTPNKPKSNLEEGIISDYTKVRRGTPSLSDHHKVEEIIAELDALVGLTTVKQLIREIQAFVEIQKRRSREKLVAEPLVLHMIFRGNPGTGKTTVARLVGKLFKEMGVLQKGHIIECERADLVGEYIGHTAQKTREQVKKALGGVLFIDEAYSLARGGEKDFGKEAIDALVKAMEDNKNNLILILAGYRNEMDWFLQTNPGLRSRFPIHIDFPDYSIDELLAIGESMLKVRQYELTADARNALRFMLQGVLNSHPYAGNARLVRNMVERTIRKQAVRLYQKSSSSREELIQILACDLCIEDLK